MLHKYDVSYRSMPNQLGRELFRCSAEDVKHAIEQCEDANRSYCEILAVVPVEQLPPLYRKVA